MLGGAFGMVGLLRRSFSLFSREDKERITGARTGGLRRHRERRKRDGLLLFHGCGPIVRNVIQGCCIVVLSVF
jgi:hypothetical protein